MTNETLIGEIKGLQEEREVENVLNEKVIYFNLTLHLRSVIIFHMYSF